MGGNTNNTSSNSSTNTSTPSHAERLYVGLDGVPPSFDLKGKIIGQGGSNLAFIRSETGGSVTLCGGEGVAAEPLHLLLEHSTKEGLHSASLLAANLIETISQEFHQTHYQQMNVPPPPAPLPGSQNIAHSGSGGPQPQLHSAPQLEHIPPPVHVNIPPPGIHIPQHVGPLVPPPVPAAAPYVLQDGLVYQAPPQHMIITTQLQVEPSATQQPDPREQQQKFHIIGHVNNQGQQFNTNIIATSNHNPNTLMIQAPYQMSAPGIPQVQQINVGQMRIQGDQHQQVQMQAQTIHPNQVHMQVQAIHPNQMQMQAQAIHPNQVQIQPQAMHQVQVQTQTLQPNQIQMQAMHPSQVQMQAQPIHPNQVQMQTQAMHPNQMQSQIVHPNQVQMQTPAMHPNQEQFIVNQSQHNPSSSEASDYQPRDELNKDQPEIATRYWQYSAATQRSGEDDNNSHLNHGCSSAYRSVTDGEAPPQNNAFISQRNDKHNKFGMASSTNRSPEQQNRKRRFEEVNWEEGRNNKRFDSKEDEQKSAVAGTASTSDNKRQREGSGRGKADTEGGNAMTWSHQKGEIVWRNSEQCDSGPPFQTRAPPSSVHSEVDNNENSYSTQKNFWADMKNADAYKNVQVHNYSGSVVQGQQQGDERTQGQYAGGAYNQQTGQGKVPYYLLPPSPPASTQMVVVQGYNNNQHTPIYSQPGAVQLNNIPQQSANMMQAPPPAIQPGGIVLTSVQQGVPPPGNNTMHPANMMQPNVMQPAPMVGNMQQPAPYNMYTQSGVMMQNPPAPVNQGAHHMPYVPNSGQNIVTCSVPPPNILSSRPQQHALTAPPPAVGHAPQPQHSYAVWTNNTNV